MPSDRRRRVRGRRALRGGLRAFAARYFVQIVDLAMLAVAMSVLTYWAMNDDIFGGRSVTIQGSRIELDEALLLVILFLCGIATVGARYHFRMRREANRRRAAERQVRELAYQDGLTGLPNRRRFDDALKAACAAPPGPDAAHALLLIDLNRFKAVNDVYGHAAGDEVLMVVAQRLLRVVRDSDLVARFGGDEFAILATHLAGEEGATSVALRAIAAIEAPIETGGTVHRVGAGIGIAMIPGDGSVIGEAMRKADVALYRVKAERRSGLRFFEPEMDARMHERAAIEAALRAAVENDRIAISYRPTIDLRTRAIVAFDAAPRWDDATRGEIPAERLMAVAEETGLIHAISETVLRGACVAATGWPAQVILAIRLQPSQLADPLLPAHIVRTLHETGLDAARLEVGITEGALLADPDHARHALGALRAAGIRVVLENFGTGYSSLHHLLAYHLDKVKIDGGFVAAMGRDPQSANVVRALIGLGRGLGLAISADGVAERCQEAALLGTGCDFAQGALFSPLLTAAEAATLVKAGAPEAAYRLAV